MTLVAVSDPLTIPEFDPDVNASTVEEQFQGLWNGLIAGGTARSRVLHNVVTGDLATINSFDFVPALPNVAAGLQVNGLVHQTDGTLTGSVLPAVGAGDIGDASGFLLFRGDNSVSSTFAYMLSFGGATAAGPHVGISWDETNEHVQLVNESIGVVSANGTVPANTWHTVGGSIVGVTSGAKRLYLDGVDVAGDTGNGAHDHSAIGIARRWDNTASRFGGQIAVWYLWNRFLSAGEHLLLHQFPFGLLTPVEDVFGFVVAAAEYLPLDLAHQPQHQTLMAS